MAKAFTLARPFPLALPFPHSQNLNKILGTQLNRKTLIISSSWTRILCSNSCNSNCINTRSNVNYVHNRGFTSIFATPLSSDSCSHLPFRTSCDCVRFPSTALLPLRRFCSSSLRFAVMSHSGEHDSNIPQDSTKTIRCVIKGRVQGVFYRNWTIENANELGLKGWVRNRRDGSVEALFSGKPEAVDDMLQRCRRGPQHAMVTAIDANPSNEDPGTGFERKATV